MNANQKRSKIPLVVRPGAGPMIREKSSGFFIYGGDEDEKRNQL